jgi:hypothetical protein
MTTVTKLVLVLLFIQLSIESESARPWLHRSDMSSNHHYQFNDDANRWTTARERCRAQGGDLVTIDDVNELVGVYVTILYVEIVSNRHGYYRTMLL